MSGLPSYDLELKATDQRRQLHTSIEELRSVLHHVFGVKENVRNHLGLTCAAAGVLGLAIGYAFTGIFTAH